MQEIRYRTKKLMKECTIYSETKKVYGERMAAIIHLRISQITASDSVEMLIESKMGRCHPLTGNRKDTYAMDLVHPYRLVFENVKGEFRVVQILEIKDYH